MIAAIMLLLSPSRKAKVLCRTHVYHFIYWMDLLDGSTGSG